MSGVVIQQLDCRDPLLQNGKLWFHALIDGVVVGSVSVVMNERWGWINDLFVIEGVRRQHIGEKLVEATVQACLNAEQLGVCAGVYDTNAPSIGLFEHMCFDYVFMYESGMRLYSYRFITEPAA